MSDHPECGLSYEQIQSIANKTNSQKNVFRKAVRAVGFLEGFGALLWTQVGPNLADEEVAEFEKRVADIAAYIGLPPRGGGCQMSRPESPKVTRAKELIKDKRLTNKQIALRCGITANYVSMLRRQMEVEK